MLNDTVVVTFSGTPIHREMQLDFHRKYGKNFFNQYSFTYDWLYNEGFVNEYWDVFQYEKYCGYFMWKPLIIGEALKFFPDKNILYCDSNLVFKDFTGFERIYSDIIKRDGVFFINHDLYLNRDWTKRDTFIQMGADDEKYWNANQIWTVCLGFSQSWFSKEFLVDYIRYCSKPQIVTESPNVSGKENFPGFREHRWEQSVVSILAKRYEVQGISDRLMQNFIDKYYTSELNKYKEEINKDPMRTR